MADNLFMDGAAISPKSSGAGTDIVDYVIVERLWLDPAYYIGAVFTGEPTVGSAGLIFQVSHIESAPDNSTNLQAKALYGRYLSAGQENTNNDVQTTVLRFNDAESLTNITHRDFESGGLLTALTVRTKPEEIQWTTALLPASSKITHK